MKKTMILLFAACLIAAIGSKVLAGNSGVASPTITVTQFTTPDRLRDKTYESLTSLNTSVTGLVATADAVQFETGSATNAQVVTFSLTYTAAPVVLVETQNATTNSYASSITTSNCTMSMVSGSTNKYVVIPVQ